MAGGVDATTFCLREDKWSGVTREILTGTGICVGIRTAKRARFFVRAARTSGPPHRAGEVRVPPLHTGARRTWEGV